MSGEASDLNSIALRLLECLNEQLALTPAGAANPTILMAGEEVEHFGGTTDDCAQAWVRLAGLYRSSNFPLPDQDLTGGGCLVAEYAAILELGVIRCWPTMGRNGAPGDPVAKQLRALDVQNDAYAMVRAVNCCWAVEDGPSYLVGTWQPTGPEGGVVGGYLQVTVAVQVCCEP